MAFLSTSRSRETAVHYAGLKQPIVIEMEMGMTGRGADLSWLSQWPHEEEVAFPPLTGYEVLSTRVEGSTLARARVRCVCSQPRSPRTTAAAHRRG